jgi:hypothetical protein
VIQVGGCEANAAAQSRSKQIPGTTCKIEQEGETAMTLFTHGVVIPIAKAAFAKARNLFGLITEAFTEARQLRGEREIARHRRIHDISPKNDDLPVVR